MSLKQRTQNSLTLGQALTNLAGDAWERPAFCNWPPDCFGAAMELLRLSGAYCLVPDILIEGIGDISKWVEACKRIAVEWVVDHSACPDAIKSAWEEVVSHEAVLLADLMQEEHRDLVICILRVVCAADEWCGAIRENSKFANDPILQALFQNGDRSLCKEVDASRMAVLPKDVTPESGITLRSLTRSLAYVPTTEVAVQRAANCAQLAYSEVSKKGTFLDVLVIPWPYEVDGVAFIPSSTGQRQRFQFSPKGSPGSLLKVIKEAIVASAKASYMPKVVVLPELAILEIELKAICGYLVERDIALVAGVRPGEQTKVNRSVLSLPGPGIPTTMEQEKHHRWKIDQGQIERYGLSLLKDASEISEDYSWWEETAVGRRRLSVAQLTNELSCTVLICEDLARQEPVGGLVRDLGPGIVFALLLDGPQQDWRWGTKYATVLNEDPGSSVLVLSSLGMVSLGAGTEAPKNVMTWAEPGKKPRHFAMTEANSLGLCLRLTCSIREGRTLDGRPWSRHAVKLGENSYKVIYGKRPSLNGDVEQAVPQQIIEGVNGVTAHFGVNVQQGPA